MIGRWTAVSISGSSSDLMECSLRSRKMEGHAGILLFRGDSLPVGVMRDLPRFRLLIRSCS